jgi:hypothetical protein
VMVCVVLVCVVLVCVVLVLAWIVSSWDYCNSRYLRFAIIYCAAILIAHDFGCSEIRWSGDFEKTTKGGDHA